MRDDTGWSSWLRGCAIGCGALLLLVALLSGLGIARIIRPLQSAVDARAELESRFGDESGFVPRADGSVDRERVSAFLAVRRGLAEVCSRLADNSAALARMEDLDQQENPSRMEVLRLAAGATRSAMGMGALMGDLCERRNRLLLESGIGLGEYSYLYVLAYQPQLADVGRTRTGILDGSPVNRRLHGVLQAMIERQLEAARAAGLSDDWIADLEREHAAMADDPDRIPWQDGLPEVTRQSLQAFRPELDATFCPAATEVELKRNVRRRFAFEME